MNNSEYWNMAKLADYAEEKVKKPRLKRGTRVKLYPPQADDNLRGNVFVNESFVIRIVRKLSQTFTRKTIIGGEPEYRKLGYSEESTNFNKLYITQSIKDNIDSLSLRAKEMYLHILYNITPGQTKIQINKDKYNATYGIKGTTFSNTKMELMQRHIILDVKKEKDVYWTNPFYFYNGNRLRTFEPHIEITHNYAPYDGYAESLEELKKEHWENINKVKANKDNGNNN